MSIFGKHASLRRYIDHHNLVCGLEKGERDSLGYVLSGDRFYLWPHLFDVLQVYGGNHGDASVEQLRDVLPAIGVSRPGRVVVSKSVDEANLRAAKKNTLDVHHRSTFNIQERYEV